MEDVRKIASTSNLRCRRCGGNDEVARPVRIYQIGNYHEDCHTAKFSVAIQYTATAVEFKETLERAQRIIDGDEPFEPEIEDDSMYMGSDSDFSDHALGIDY